MRIILLALLFAFCVVGGCLAMEDSKELRLNDLTSEWERLEPDLIWGFHNLYNPRVVYNPTSGYPYLMWLFGWSAEDSNPDFPGADATFFARSKDLLKWEVWSGEAGWDTTMDPRKWVPVLTADDKGFDNVHNGDPSVVFHAGRYYMAFSSVGFDTRKDAEEVERLWVVSCVMGAVSDDGIHWTKSTSPIAIWEDEYTNGWEIVDGKIPPAAEDYYGSYHRPSLMWDQGHWRLWFDYFLPGTFVSLGYAENGGDFLEPAAWQIKRAGTEPLLRDFPNPSVVRAGEKYYAFSDAPNFPPEYGGDGRLLTMAISDDGLDWRVLGHLAPEGVESAHVPEAFVKRDAEGLWLYVFYSWKPQVEPWDYRYKKIRAIRKLLEPAPLVP